jgi:hypothetical protein
MDRENVRGGVKSLPSNILLCAEVSVKLIENPAGAPAPVLPSGSAV